MLEALDNCSTFAFLIDKNSLSAFSECGYFAGTPLRYIKLENIPWFKGKPPVAVPKCGFDGEKCKKPSEDAQKCMKLYSDSQLLNDFRS